jgi:hypothetical protein
MLEPQGSRSVASSIASIEALNQHQEDLVNRQDNLR